MELDPREMKRARELKGLSQSRLGEMLDPPCTWRTIAHYEKGDYKPKPRRREQLMAILEIGDHEPVVASTAQINMPRHELIQALLDIRTTVDGVLSKA